MEFKMPEASDAPKVSEVENKEISKEARPEFDELMKDDDLPEDLAFFEEAENEYRVESLKEGEFDFRSFDEGERKDVDRNPWGFPEMREESMWEALRHTNPKYKEADGYKINCQRCVSAYEARRRGYDVTAKPYDRFNFSDRLPTDNLEEGWPSVYKDPHLISCRGRDADETKKAVEELMESYGDGARAIVAVNWKYGGGHVFIAERVGGQTFFIDPQANSFGCGRYFKLAENEVQVLRVDNREFTNRIKDCCEGGEKNGYGKSM